MGSSSKPVLVAVVDDDDLIRNSIADLLSSAGIESQTFSSGEEFLADGASQEIFCLVTDIRMPGMTGLELQRKLLEHHSWLPIIFITALEDTRLRAQAMRAGAVEFLLKPVDDQVLLRSVQAALKCSSLAVGGETPCQ
jgi:two-component system, LuxR family, response regulator FixJ